MVTASRSVVIPGNHRIFPEAQHYRRSFRFSRAQSHAVHIRKENHPVIFCAQTLALSRELTVARSTFHVELFTTFATCGPVSFSCSNRANATAQRPFTSLFHALRDFRRGSGFPQKMHFPAPKRKQWRSLSRKPKSCALTILHSRAETLPAN